MVDYRVALAAVRDRCASMPRWVLGTVCLLAVIVGHEWLDLDHPYVRSALFAVAMALPGTFLSGRGTHAVTMVVVCMLVTGIHWALWWYGDLLDFVPSYILTPVLLTFNPMIFMVALGSVEWWFSSERRSRHLFGWTMVACIGGASVSTIVVHLSLGLLPEEDMASSRRTEYVSIYLPWLIWCVIFWLSIATGQRLADTTRGVYKACAVLAVILLILMAQWYLNVLVYDLAKRSLAGAGPFPRDFGVYILGTRGRESDYEFILRQLAAFEPGPREWRWAMAARHHCEQYYGDEFAERLMQMREEMGLPREGSYPFFERYQQEQEDSIDHPGYGKAAM